MVTVLDVVKVLGANSVEEDGKEARMRNCEWIDMVLPCFYFQTGCHRLKGNKEMDEFPPWRSLRHQAEKEQRG